MQKAFLQLKIFNLAMINFTYFAEELHTRFH